MYWILLPTLISCFVTLQYNGCVWKGGRLRLEKAKEHYLVSLKREWAEKAELASRGLTNSYNSDEDMASYDKPKKVINSERKQLRIYFPNLRRVGNRGLEDSLF